MHNTDRLSKTSSSKETTLSSIPFRLLFFQIPRIKLNQKTFLKCFLIQLYTRNLEKKRSRKGIELSVVSLKEDIFDNRSVLCIFLD